MSSFFQLAKTESVFLFSDVQADMICSIEDDCCSIHLPLARIIPGITGKIHDVFSESKNDYLLDISSLECAKSFAANIYEAFSNKPKETQQHNII